jgi:hypothetical protein
MLVPVAQEELGPSRNGIHPVLKARVIESPSAAIEAGGPAARLVPQSTPAEAIAIMRTRLIRPEGTDGR